MGQRPPGEKPELFARGMVSSVWGLHSAVAISPDGNAAMWAPMITIPGKPYSEGGVLIPVTGYSTSKLAVALSTLD